MSAVHYMLIISITISQIASILCFYESCNHQLSLKADGKLFINTPNYPGNYPTKSSCQYTVTAPSDYQLNFRCNIKIYADPASGQCTAEVFQFNGGVSSSPETYCGSKTIERKSTENQAVISYVSTSAETGWFTCYVEVSKKPCDCGNAATPRIVGGVQTDITEFPSMAGVVNLRHNRIFCGAALIHYRFLLSAAHCFVSQLTSVAADLVVIVGALELSAFNLYYTKLYEVEEVIRHPLFKFNPVQNDIAIIRTVENIMYVNGVEPACLPFRWLNTDFSGAQLETAGWGTTAFGGEQSEKLMKTTLNVLNGNECKSIVGDLTVDQFCTFSPGTDTCQYDSGGGMYYRYDRMYLTGIVSYGYACATDVPSVNTRVAIHLPWILNNTWKADFCRLY